MEMQKQKAEKIFENVTKKKQIHESVLFIENSTGDTSYRFGYGGKDTNTPFLIASITKLFTTTCLFILMEKGKLSLHDEISRYLDQDLIRNLHVYKGNDHSNELKISHLLFHTSGLRDVIEEGSSKLKLRALEQDEQTELHETILQTKEIEPYFAPDAGKRAHYANINFEILGKIIETITDLPLEQVYARFIFTPLGLRNTYLPKDENDFIPSIYYKDITFDHPKSLLNIRASGGCISTAEELIVFIKAFFHGKLFKQSIFDELDERNRLQSSMLPIHYGAGYMRIPLSGLATLFMGKGELMGHSGSTGSFAFYYPEKDLFIVGDVNQMVNPATPVRLAMRLAMTFED